VKRDEELQAISKLIFPAKMTLLNNTVTYQYKKKDKP